MPGPAIASGLWCAGSALLIALSSLACSPSSRDADRDGVPDPADHCPRTPAEREVDARGCSDLGRALARGIEAILAESTYTIGDLWVLQELHRLSPYPELERLVERRAEAFSSNPLLRQIDPSAPRIPLPADPGRGIRRLYHYVQAPFGRPESRALVFIRDFLSSEESGYALTHQFLVIEWARESGLQLPDVVTAQRPKLLERIGAEQAADPSFSDLFAERAALLIRFTEPPPAAAHGWIDTLLAAQLLDGGWEDSTDSVLVFDGQRAPAFHPRSHTTAWAQLALTAFSLRY